MMMKKTMIAGAVLALSFATFAATLEEYEDRFAAGPTPARAAAGFECIRLYRETGRDNDALLTGLKLAALPNLPGRDKCRVLHSLCDTAFSRLNNVKTAKSMAAQLLRHPAATEAEKTYAGAMLEKCRIKHETTDLLDEDIAPAKVLAAQVRRDHPRLFLTCDTLDRFRKHLTRPEIQAYYQKFVKAPVAALPTEPQLYCGDTGLTRTPQNTYERIPKPRLYGLDSARCALIYLAEGDEEALDKARQLLSLAEQALDESFKTGSQAGDYYGMEVVYAISAYDWIYNRLTPDERIRFAKAFLTYACRAANESNRFAISNGTPEGSGFYGVRMLKWYAGLAAVNDNIDDPLALKMLYEGYLDHEVMLRSRNITAGKDGGFVSCANNYVMNAYPWSSLNYLHTMRSGLGRDRAREQSHLTTFPQWCAWNMIPAEKPRTVFDEIAQYTTGKLDFGIGDTTNTDKVMPNADMHMYEILHLIPDDPELARTALGAVNGNPLDSNMMQRFRQLTPLLLYDMPPLIEPGQAHDPGFKEQAHFFPNLGVAFFRSGSGIADTYACFISNKRIWQHRHYDANSFMIYKYDFLALDTGTRLGFQRRDYEHLNAYYAQSVAHNTVLIHMPEELLPPHWLTVRGEVKYYNHGGQNGYVGDRCAGYATNPFFSYIAGDATAVYSAKKCELALRQFVFLPPNLFVVSDRVVSTRPEYRKEWLLHTQNEPVPAGEATYRADSGKGRLFCRTVLPRGAKITIVGGKGNEFFASGVNWALPEGGADRADSSKSAIKAFEEPNYMGRYRLEVTPPKESKEARFLHVLEVGDTGLARMASTEALETADSFGVRITDGDRTWTVSFAGSGKAAGRVRCEAAGTVLIDRGL